MRSGSLLCLIFFINLLMPRDALSSGLALRLNSAILEGQANAGSAVTDDPLAMFNNPASAILHTRAEVAVHGVGLFPVTKFRGTTTNPLIPAITEKANSGNAAKSAFVPAAAFLFKPHERLALGIVGTAPFGLGFDYGNHWGGNRYAIKTDLRTLNFVPTVAVRLHDMLSIGGGVQIQNSKALFKSQSSSTNPIVQFLFQNAETRQKAKLQRWGVGWTAGFLLEPNDCFKVGFSYRSQIKSTLHGFLTFENVPAPLQNNPFLQANKARTKIKYPQIFTLSASYKIDPRWTVLFDVIRTDWSSLNTLILSTPLNPNANITQQKWKDVWFFAGGVNYMYSNEWTFRGGVGFDQGPSRTKYRVPGIPDSDKLVTALGATYTPNCDWSFSLSYCHEFFRRGRVNLKNSNLGNAGKGDLKGNLRTHVDFVGLQVNYKI
jgi:long-chain fatty acid transport protein